MHAEAILIGLWGVIEQGWLERLPPGSLPLHSLGFRTETAAKSGRRKSF